MFLGKQVGFMMLFSVMKRRKMLLRKGTSLHFCSLIVRSFYCFLVMFALFLQGDRGNKGLPGKDCEGTGAGSVTVNNTAFLVSCY